MSQVSMIDTSIAQVLLAATRSAQRLGLTLVVATGGNPTVPDVLRRLGLSTSPA